MRRALALIVLTALLMAPFVPMASAVTPGEEFANAAQETRARTLFRELRCMVCQNQSIDASEAPLARDLRGLVREQIAAGQSDADIKRFLVDRYGSFVLLRPPFGISTMLLWGAPILVLVGGLGAIAMALSRRRRGIPAEPPLDAAETERLRALLNRPTEPT